MRTTQVLRLLLCVVMASAASVACLAMEEAPEDRVTIETSDPEDRVTIEFRDMDIREALENLFRGRGLSFSLAADVSGKIPYLTFRDVPFREAFKSLLMTAGLVMRRDAHVYRIARKPGYDPFAKQVNVEFKDTPLADAIETLMKDAGINYTVDPSVNQLKVTAVLRNVSLAQALAEITKAAGAEYRLTDGVVNISRPPGYVSTVWVPVTGSTPVRPGPAPGADLRTEVIPVSFADPGDIAPFLVQEGIHSVSAVSGRRLMVRGTDEAIEREKQMIRMLDVPVKTVRVELSARALADGDVVFQQSAIVTTFDDQLAYLSIRVSPSSGGKLDGTAEVELIPYVDLLNRVTITGSAKFSFLVQDTSSGGVRIESPMITFATSLTAGQDMNTKTMNESGVVVNSEKIEPVEKQIAAVEVTGPEGRTIMLELTAKATLEDYAMRVPPARQIGPGNRRWGNAGSPGVTPARPGYRTRFGGPIQRTLGSMPVVSPPPPNPEEIIKPAPPPVQSAPAEPAPPPR